MKHLLWRPFWLSSLAIGVVFGQAIPPNPSAPPAFMTMRGLPLSCFDRPNFEEDGLEFFVCNGGGGIAGVSKTNDPAHTIFVRDRGIAQNLNMQAAKRQCGKKHFFVRRDRDGIISFGCQEKPFAPGDENLRDAPTRSYERFRPASRTDWKKYLRYLN